MTATKREKISISQLMAYRLNFKREHVTPWIRLIGRCKVGIRQLKAIVRQFPSHVAARVPFISTQTTDDADLLKNARTTYYDVDNRAHASSLVDMAGCLIRAEALRRVQGDMYLIESFLGYGPNLPLPMLHVLSDRTLYAWEADEDLGTELCARALAASYGYEMALADLQAASDVIALRYALNLIRSFSKTVAQALCVGDEVDVQAARLEGIARTYINPQTQSHRLPSWGKPPQSRSRRLVSWDGDNVLMDLHGEFVTMSYGEFAKRSPARDALPPLPVDRKG